MPFFTYKAINNNGEVVKGLVEENDAELAYDSIAALDLHILSIKKSTRYAELYLKKLRSWSIKPSEVVECAKNLAVTQKAGLPIIMAIADIAETTENKHFSDRLLDIKRNIELGSGFSDSLARHKDIFPEIFINLVIIGEETGRLSESLAEAAQHMQRVEDLKSAIVRAMMYPIFALVGTSGALLFWLIYVLPKMSELFSTMSIELPPLTVFLISASAFSSEYWYLYLLLPVIGYLIPVVLKRFEKTKYYIDAAKLKLPVMKILVSNMLLALFAEQLKILVSAGVTIDRSLDIMMKVIGNSVFKKALLQIKEDIMLGNRMSEAIKCHPKLFPNMVVRMISIGESAGNLNEQLHFLSEYYMNKLDDISEKMGKMIEPIIIMIVGAMFLLIIFGLMAPIYDIIGGIGE